jgi:tetratricopeptide (TPR) repeat protein
MLSLVHAGWDSTRALARAGRRSAAVAQLNRLLAVPGLPASVAADARRLAGELLTDAGKYAEARRHLRAAAKLEPGHARTQYLLGLAWERDPDGCDRRAAVRYKKALAGEPANALYRAAFGRAAARCGMARRGVRELIAAAHAAPADPAVVRVVVGGLTEAGRLGAARRVLVAARFARPGCGELLGLWNRLRFEAARVGQKDHRRTEDAGAAREGGVVLLPFLRVAGAGRKPAPAGRGPKVRRDVISLPRPHLARRRARRADR